jgi:AcrR family transcriptional regulator
MPPTRDRIVTATAELLRRQGYNGTGLKQISSAAEATLGSIYHFFPGGKADLAEEAIRVSSAAYLELLELIWSEAPNAPTAVTDFFDAAAHVLEETEYIDACPIGTVALEVASSMEGLREATADVFDSWISSVATRLRDVGIARRTSHELAVALVATFEGGLMLSRATRSSAPLRSTGKLARKMVADAMTGGGAPVRSSLR